MARRNRRRSRPSQAWHVQGDAETVRQVSFHRMIETLSALQLEALEAMVDLRELELSFQAMIATTGLARHQLDVFQAAIARLPYLTPEMQIQLARALQQLTPPGLPNPAQAPNSHPPQGG